MTPNELKALIDLKFNGVDIFREKIIKDPNVINKPEIRELKQIIKTGQPVNLFNQLVKMATYYSRHKTEKRTLTRALCITIRNEVIKQYGTFDKFCLTHEIERSFLDRIVNNRLTKKSDRVNCVCDILGILV